MRRDPFAAVLLGDGCRLRLLDSGGRPLIDASLGALSLAGVSLEFVYTPAADPDYPDAPAPAPRRGRLIVGDAP